MKTSSALAGLGVMHHCGVRVHIVRINCLNKLFFIWSSNDNKLVMVVCTGRQVNNLLPKPLRITLDHSEKKAYYS